jgi:hypothetical protein
MDKRQQVQEIIFYGSKFGGDGWPPEDPAGFMAWFQECIDRIPRAHRATARIEIGAQSEYYGESAANIEITYMRDETDDQFSARLQRDKAHQQRKIAEEKRMLSALLAKHGAP